MHERSFEIAEMLRGRERGAWRLEKVPAQLKSMQYRVVHANTARRLCHPKLVKGQTGLSPVTPIISNGLRYCRPVARCFPTALTTDVIKCRPSLQWFNGTFVAVNGDYTSTRGKPDGPDTPAYRTCNLIVTLCTGRGMQEGVFVPDRQYFSPR